jgi:hypothetical protein
VTLIAGIMGVNGLMLSADTEESIPEPNALRTHGEKIYVLQPSLSDWKIVIAGAGDVDWIGMIRDFIWDNASTGNGTDAEILSAIRKAIHEIWKNYVQYDRAGANVSLLIGSWSADHLLRFRVVRNTTIRNGRDLEACGVGDSIFRALADRFLNYGRGFRYIAGDIEALRFFVIYAMQQAKTVPGIGGNTRIVTLDSSGNLKWEKSFKIGAIQTFFRQFDGDLRLLIAQSEKITSEEFVRTLSKSTLRRIKQLRKEIERIEHDPILA